MEISATMVMDLRKQTGLPMMDCKKALSESHGDVKKAIDWLRQRGLSKVIERADNVTANGRIFVHKNAAAGRIGMAAIGCETEPVTATDDFQALGRAVAVAASTIDNPTPESVRPVKSQSGKPIGDLLEDALIRIREKIIIANVGAVQGHGACYVHHNGMVGVLVEFNQACPELLGLDICMHVAAMNPRSLKREDVAPDEVDAERARKKQAVLEEGKPAAMVDKIVEGKMGSWFKDFVLLEQPFVKDDKKSVQQVLTEAAKGLTIQRFLRFKVGA